jgi:hypothetical protein
MPADGLYGTLGGLYGEATDEALYPAYHVILAGQGLMLPPGGYERTLSQQFAAKLSISGTAESDRIGEQQALINDWGGGEGLTRLGTTPASDRYRRGAGINIYDEDSAIGLGPYMAAPAALQTAFNSITAIANYRQYLVIGRNDGKVYRWDGATLDLAGDTGKSSGGITAFGLYESNLYIGNGQDGDVWRWVGENPGSGFASNFTVGGISGGGVAGVFSMATHYRGTLQGAYFGMSPGATGQSYAGQFVNTAGTASSGTAGSLIVEESKIAVLHQYGDTLLAAATWANARHWRLYSGSNADPVVWSHKAVVLDSRATCAATLNGIVYFGDAIMGRIWKWDGSRLTLYCQLGSDLVPYTTEITGMCTWRGALWIAIRDTDGTCALLRDDGNGIRSRPVTGLTGTTPGGVVVFQDQLHYVTQATGATKIFRTNGTYAATGWVESPLMNANLDGTGKTWLGVEINHSALAATQSVLIQYQLNDTGSWTTLGTSDVDGANTAAFDFPIGVTSNQIGFKLTLTGTAGSATPLRVFSLVARYLPSSEGGKEWQLTVLMFGTDDIPMPLSDGSNEPLTGQDLSDYVWSLVDAGSPVAFLDIDRQEYLVSIAGWAENFSARVGGLQQRATSVGWSLEGKMRLREVQT